MAHALQQLINGLTLGAVYGLIAIGYTMVYGIIGMINFAHGDIYMVGAFIAVTAFTLLAAAGRDLGAAGADHRAVRRDPVHLGLRLGGRAHRLPSAARFDASGAADLGDRHVDLPAEHRADDAGRARQADAADARRRHRVDAQRRLHRHRLPIRSC